jgi:YidC/Oxa1 family membrane protein insertase
VNVIYQAMLYLLDLLHSIVGNYGLAIVLLTILIRVALWPLNSAQTRSMRRMQEIQPKMKALQERYKAEPQKLQEAMMKCYKESGLNPMAGCLPMLAQIPIFLGLYGALSSPQFLAETVHERFLFVDNLSHTLQSHAGKSLDGVFDVTKNDTFSSGKTIKLALNTGVTQDQEVANENGLIHFIPKPILPGAPVTMTLDFRAMGLSDDYRNLVKSADVLVVNNQSRELERVHFNNANGVLTQQVPTRAPAGGQAGMNWNWDVLVLVLLYGALTLGYQKVMTAWAPKPSQDDPTAAMQASTMKFMPLIFVVMMFFIPIPAGALIYLVVTTALMMLQTVWVNKAEDKRVSGGSQPPSGQVVNIKADRA